MKLSLVRLLIWEDKAPRLGTHTEIIPQEHRNLETEMELPSM